MAASAIVTLGEVRTRALRSLSDEETLACLRGSEQIGTARAGDVVIVIQHSVMASMERLVAEGAPLEQAGVLLGAAYEAGDGYLLEILDVLPFPVTVPEESRVRVSRRAWPEVLKMRSARGPNLRIVGWYHSHTGSGAIFTDPDRFIQRYFFPADWQVACVLDTVKQETQFFQMQGRAVVPVGGFFLASGRQSPPSRAGGASSSSAGASSPPASRGGGVAGSGASSTSRGAVAPPPAAPRSPGGSSSGVSAGVPPRGATPPPPPPIPPMGGSRSQSGSGSFAGGLGSSSSSRGAESLRGRSEGLRPPERGSAGEQRGESPLRAPLRGEGRTSRSQGGEEAMPSGPFDTGSESRSSARESGDNFLRERFVERSLEKIVRLLKEPPMGLRDYAVLGLLVLVAVLVIWRTPRGISQAQFDELKQKLDQVQQQLYQVDSARTVAAPVVPPSPSPAVAAEAPVPGGEEPGGSPSPSASPMEVRVYVMKSGETLWGVCEEEYKDGSLVGALMKFNEISDSEEVKVGQKVRLPSREILEKMKRTLPASPRKGAAKAPRTAPTPVTPPTPVSPP